MKKYHHDYSLGKLFLYSCDTSVRNNSVENINSINKGKQKIITNIFKQQDKWIFDWEKRYHWLSDGLLLRPWWPVDTHITLLSHTV